MGCRKTEKSLIDYIDGKLGAGARERVEEHLQSCPSCAAQLEKLELSGAALASLDRPALSEEASSRMLDAIRAGQAPVGRKSFFLSPGPAIAAGAIAVIAVVSVFVAIGLGTSNKRKADNSTVTRSGQQEASIPALDGSQTLAQPSAGKMMATINPIVIATENDYDKDTLRAAFDALPERRQFADNFTMADSVRLSGNYSCQICEKFATLGEDENMLRSMISSITFSEPVLLPYYVEKAKFTGRQVWIVAFVGPRKSGGNELSRNEVWVMDPAKFASEPNASYVFFLEQRLDQ